MKRNQTAKGDLLLNGQLFPEPCSQQLQCERTILVNRKLYRDNINIYMFFECAYSYYSVLIG